MRRSRSIVPYSVAGCSRSQRSEQISPASTHEVEDEDAGATVEDINDHTGAIALMAADVGEDGVVDSEPCNKMDVFVRCTAIFSLAYFFS